MKFRAIAIAALATATFFVSTATAQAGLLSSVLGTVDKVTSPILQPCDQTGISQPFSAWGDNRHYVPAPGGTFERRSQGWDLGPGATLTRGGNPHGSDGYALTLEPGGSATSPPICVHIDYTVSRMFARTVAGDSPLKVEVLYDNALLGRASAKAADLPPVRSWGPTETWDMPVLSQINLDLTSSSGLAGGTEVRFRFTAPDDGSWKVDDVWVDPRMRK